MEKPRRLVSFANTFGALGYISVFFQWTWTLLLAAYPILMKNPDFLLPQPDKRIVVQPIEVDASFAPILSIIAIVATVLILAISIVVIIRMPKTIGKKASALTHATVKKVVPVLTQHKKISQKTKLKLSKRLITVIKLSIILFPLLILIFVAPTDQLSITAMWTVAIFSAVCSMLYFSIQALIAYFGKISYKQLW